jgi:hypothetical protein
LLVRALALLAQRGAMAAETSLVVAIAFFRRQLIDH